MGNDWKSELHRLETRIVELETYLRSPSGIDNKLERLRIEFGVLLEELAGQIRLLAEHVASPVMEKHATGKYKNIRSPFETADAGFDHVDSFQMRSNDRSKSAGLANNRKNGNCGNVVGTNKQGSGERATAGKTRN